MPPAQLVNTTQIMEAFAPLKFASGARFTWSPRRQAVIFPAHDECDDDAIHALLHEIGHASLKHESFTYDIELLQMEIEAWDKAHEIAVVFNYQLNQDHVHQCLEGYREWMYKRSRCPACYHAGIQDDQATFRCAICRFEWRVTPTRSIHTKRLRA